MTSLNIPNTSNIPNALTSAIVAAAVLAGGGAARAAGADPARAYPALAEYLMPREAEIALAKSAAPAHISAHATIKVLTESGFTTVASGDNGFVCLVLRGWAAPSFSPAPFRDLVYDATLRAPICYDPIASRTVLPMQELRTRLGLERKDPDTIAREVSAAYAAGQIPKMEGAAFAYMWSAGQRLGPAGAFHPHIMVYAPYYRNAMLGGNEPDGAAPFVSDDAGTPFTVVVVPVHGVKAIEPAPAPAPAGAR